MSPFEDDWADVLPDHGKQARDLRRANLIHWIGGIAERPSPPVLIVHDQTVERERLILSALASAPEGTTMTGLVLNPTWSKDAAAEAFVSALSWLVAPGTKDPSAWAWLEQVMSKPRSVIQNPLQSVLNSQDIDGPACVAIRFVLDAQAALRERDQVTHEHLKGALSAWLSGGSPGSTYKQLSGKGRSASHPATARSRLDALCALFAFAVDQGVFQHPVIVLDEPPRGRAVEAVVRMVPVLKIVASWCERLGTTPIGIVLGVKTSHVRSILSTPELKGMVTTLSAT